MVRQTSRVGKGGNPSVRSVPSNPHESLNRPDNHDPSPSDFGFLPSLNLLVEGSTLSRLTTLRSRLPTQVQTASTRIVDSTVTNLGACRPSAQGISVPPSGRDQEATRRPSSCRSQPAHWFQLANVWLTTLVSPLARLGDLARFSQVGRAGSSLIRSQITVASQPVDGGTLPSHADRHRVRLQDGHAGLPQEGS